MPSAEQWSDLEARLTRNQASDDSLTEKFILGSGSGGQKINKTASCVYLKHHPSGIEIKCQAHRSREQNRYQARLELCQRLEQLRQQAQQERRDTAEKKRRSNRPRSRNSKNRMLKGKAQQSKKKKLRRRPGMND